MNISNFQSLKAGEMKRLSEYTLLTTLIILVIGGIIIRLKNPDMTETRLLIEFWPYWTGVVLVILALSLINGRNKKP